MAIPKYYIALAVLVLGVIVGASLYFRSHSTAASAGYSYSACVPATDEACPTDAWYADYERLRSLNDAITRDQQSPAWRVMQDKVDQSAGIATRLRSQIPQGFDWSVAKKRFVRLPATPSTPSK